MDLSDRTGIGGVVMDLVSKLICLSVVLLVTMGCSSSEDPRPAAKVIVSREAYFVESAPKPDVVDGKCDNCNGTGKVGDGRVEFPCEKCGGDGKLSMDGMEALYQLYVSSEGE